MVSTGEYTNKYINLTDKQLQALQDRLDCFNGSIEEERNEIAMEICSILSFLFETQVTETKTSYATKVTNEDEPYTYTLHG
jgi:hypothetical protein